MNQKKIVIRKSKIWLVLLLLLFRLVLDLAYAWNRWFNSKERRLHCVFASGISSLPHIQDWPAIWQLKEKSIVPNDSIFVPGHTPMLSLVGKPNRNETYERAIFNKHYLLKRTNKGLTEVMINRIKKFEEIDKLHAFYIWECNERQTKFIANSIRVYEFWDYDWWLPFWDAEFYNFCLKLPKEIMANKILFKQFVNSQFYELTGTSILTTNDSGNPVRKLIVRNMPTKLKATLKLILKSNKKILINEYNSHPLAWWGVYNMHEYIANAKYYANINSALAIDYINSIETL